MGVEPRKLSVASRNRFVPRHGLIFIGVAATFWLVSIAVTIHRVLTFGRGGFALTYDDVVYARVGQSLYLGPPDASLLSRFTDWVSNIPHAPVTEFAAFAAHALPIPAPQSIYVLSSVIAALLLLALTCVIIENWGARFLLAGILGLSPLGYVLADEYRPDLWFTLIAAIALAGNVPYRLGPNRAAVISPTITALLSLSLIFIKPSWLALAGGTTIAAGTGAVIASLLQRSDLAPQMRRKWLTAIALYALGVLIWWVWLRSQFLDYVSAVLKDPYRLSGSGSEAVSESLRGGLAYLQVVGDLLLPAAAIVAILLAWALVRTNERSQLLIAIALSAILPAAAAANLAATWYSRHPSQFQGLFSLILLVIWILLLGSTAIRFLIASSAFHLSRRAGAWMTPLAFLIGLALLVNSPSDLTYPEVTRLPDAPVVAISNAIAKDCLENNVCSGNEIPMRILVGFAEDVNNSGIEYYTNAAGAPTLVAGADMNAISSEQIAAASSDFDYIVTRSADYPANKLPLNQIQDELTAILKNDSDFQVVQDEGVPPAYVIFRKRT